MPTYNPSVTPEDDSTSFLQIIGKTARKLVRRPALAMLSIIAIATAIRNPDGSNSLTSSPEGASDLATGTNSYSVMGGFLMPVEALEQWRAVPYSSIESLQERYKSLPKKELNTLVDDCALKRPMSYQEQRDLYLDLDKVAQKIRESATANDKKAAECIESATRANEALFHSGRNSLTASGTYLSHYFSCETRIDLELNPSNEKLAQQENQEIDAISHRARCY